MTVEMKMNAKAIGRFSTIASCTTNNVNILEKHLYTFYDKYNKSQESNELEVNKFSLYIRIFVSESRIYKFHNTDDIYRHLEYYFKQLS